MAKAQTAEARGNGPDESIIVQFGEFTVATAGHKRIALESLNGEADSNGNIIALLLAAKRLSEPISISKNVAMQRQST